MKFPWQQSEREREIRGEMRSLRLGRPADPRLASLAATKTAALKSELEDERRAPARDYLAGAPVRRAEATADREAEAGA